MTDFEERSDAELSKRVMRAAAFRPESLSFRSEDLRTYEDPRLLDAAWQRLAQRPEKGAIFPSGALLSRALAAAAILALGIGIGRRIEQRAHVVPELSQLTSEQSAPTSAPAVEEAREIEERATENRSRPVQRATSNSRVKRAQVSLSRKSTEIQEGASVESGSAERAAWLQFAELGEYQKADQALEKDGIFEQVLSLGSPDELMALADVARFAGRPVRAILALREVTTRYEADPNTPLAAMMLGNLLSQAGDAEGAARAYALNRRLSPDGDFAQDALIREFDMALAARDTVRVGNLLQQYEAAFATGKHLAEMRADAKRLFAQLELERAERVAAPSDKPVAAPEERDGAAQEEPEDVGEGDPASLQ